jgi:hypothetical protein
MTDKVACMATLKENDRVQLYVDSLYVVVSGGPRGFEYRVDDRQASSMQLVGHILTDVGAIKFVDEDFRVVRNGRRLRMNVLTYLYLQKFDLNISGINAVLDFISTSPSVDRLDQLAGPLRRCRCLARSPPRAACTDPDLDPVGIFELDECLASLALVHRRSLWRY